MPYPVQLIFIILTSGLPCAVLAIGIFITYRLLDFADLTAEGSFVLGGATCLTLIRVGVNAIPATIIAFFVGAICGIVTGLLHTKLKIPKLLSGIITLTATASIGLIIMGAQSSQIFTNLVNLSNTDQTIYSMFQPGNMWNIVVEAAVMFAIVVLVFIVNYYFFGTQYGMAIRATGMNKHMARAQGINTNLATVVGVSISNALIGLAGAMFAQDQRAMDIKSASGFLVIGLASILIGEAIFGKRSFKIRLLSVCLGAIVYFIIVNLALAAGFPTQLKNLLYAVLITLALCIPLFKKLFKKLPIYLNKRKRMLETSPKVPESQEQNDEQGGNE